MPYDEKLAQQLRHILAVRTGVSEQPMFGGLCFLLNGNMLCGVNRERLMFRVGKEQDAVALARPGAQPMNFTGRTMPGFVFVDSARCEGQALAQWVDLAARYVGELPPKEKASRASRSRSAHPETRIGR